MSSDEIWAVDAKYSTYAVTQLDGANKRIRTDDGLWFNLDDAIVAKYAGTFTKGEVDQEWTTTDLTEKSILFIQYDETKNKTDDTYDALAVYDLFINVPVTVNGKETKDVEYWLKDFNNVTVDLKEYEMIKTAEMGNKNLDVTYYDLDGKKIENFDEIKGTKVSKAVISSDKVVTGPIEITTKNQAAYINAALKEGDYSFEAAKQSITVAEGSITVNTNAQTVNVTNLKALLKAAALGTNYQTIEVYNTNDVELASGEVANDMYVKVTAWDGKTTATYQITVDANPVG